MRSQTSENILLESEVRDVPDRDRARITHAVLECNSRLRRHCLELAIIDYYYLAVRARRSGSVRDYVLDLRFAERSIRAARHIPWKWMLMTLALASATVLGLRHAVSSSPPGWWQHRLLLCAITPGLTACSGLVCAWRTTETVMLRSVHGGATLLEFTGGLGTLRSSRNFTRKLAAHIQLAAVDRKAAKGKHLRDEMREHFRLKEAGVLSEEQYEASKVQILAQHTPVRRARRP